MLDQLTIRNRCFIWGKRTYIMGILNVTPDSFSDGGKFNTISAAVTQAQAMVAAGADIIDIGGQSTRPGAIQVSVNTELDRVLSVLEVLRPVVDVPISVDTTRSEVAKAAIQAGADLVNDISAGTYDPEMLPTVASFHVPIVLMHIRGKPDNMSNLTDYKDLMSDIYNFLDRRITDAVQAGIDKNKIIIDPGIGFAKNHQQNLEIFRRLRSLKTLNAPILVGASRKSFIANILNQPDPTLRVWGTAAACCAAIFNGADILRVHDVQEMQEVTLVTDAIFRHSH
ncbi:MAG: dihydropteroate synthase [Dolichospermum sp.]